MKGQPIEDTRVEVKAVWPSDSNYAARRIPGHANAAGGESILWLIKKASCKHGSTPFGRS